MSREGGLSRVLHPDIKDKSEHKGDVNGTAEICGSWPCGEMISLLEIRVILSAGKERGNNKLLKNYLCAGNKKNLWVNTAPSPSSPMSWSPKICNIGEKIFTKYLVKSLLPSLQAGCCYGGWARAVSQHSASYFLYIYFICCLPKSFWTSGQSKKTGCEIFSPFLRFAQIEGEKKRHLFCSGMVYSSSKDRNDAIWLRWLITQLEE